MGDGREDQEAPAHQHSRRSADGVKARLLDRRVGVAVWGGEVDQAITSASASTSGLAAAIRRALLPVNFSQRWTITSQ